MRGDCKKELPNFSGQLLRAEKYKSTYRGGGYPKTADFVSELLTLSAGVTADTVPDEDLIPF